MELLRPSILMSAILPALNFWTRAPLFRLLLPFVAGILVAVYLVQPLPYGYYVLGGLAVALAIIHYLGGSYRYRALFGVANVLFYFVAGYLLANAHTEQFASDHFSKLAKPGTALVVELDEPLLPKARSFKTVLQVRGVLTDSALVPASGQLLAYFQKDSAAAGLQLGDVLVTNCRFADVQPPGNPAQFNYRQYLAFHNIYHQAYIPAGEWQPPTENRANPVMLVAHETRKQLLGVLKKHGLQGDELAVASALMLGYKAELDKDLVRAYSSAGATHVLAVSGLHVGIVFLLLNSFLGFFDRLTYGRFFKAVLLIVAIWCYAFLTGLSPSVMRAATMFSFIIVAGATGRRSNIYNTLAASAIFLLCINPYLVMEVGFQLSYLAVIGIVLLQPPIYQLWEPRWGWVDKIWAISAVSIAAQIATSPLGLLYFHQFPNYFLVSNLLVIPLASVIIYTGAAIFLLSPFDAVAGFLTDVLHYCVWGLNYSVRIIENLPFAILEGISINILETWMLYAFVALLTAYGFLNQRKYLFTAFGLIAVFLGIQVFENWQHEQQARFVVYDVRNTSAYDFIHGRQHLFVADTALLHDENSLLFNVYHHWWERGLTNRTNAVVHASEPIALPGIYYQPEGGKLGEKRIAVARSWPNTSGEMSLQVDVLVVAGNPRGKMAELLAYYQPGALVFDSSNKRWQVEKWVAELEAIKPADLRVHWVERDGAFVLDV